MKRVLFFMLVLAAGIAQANTSNGLPVERIDKYDRNPEMAVLIPTDFADNILLTPELIEQVSGKKIHHIDLVYTAYKQSEDFDQNALNEARIAELKKILPQIETDHPSWKLIEQEGAKTAREAKDYYHGFIIHFSDYLNFDDLSEFFGSYQTPFTEFVVNCDEACSFTYESGSVLHVPSNAVMHLDGSPVTGEYTIMYKEFRNQADIAFSGIPMKYGEDGMEYNFHSAGMYEIRGYQNGEELKLKKPITVDFNCTEQADGIDFYALNDQSDEWNKLHSIEFSAEITQTEIEQIETQMQIADNVPNEFPIAKRNFPIQIGGFHHLFWNPWTWETEAQKNELEVDFNATSWKKMRKVIQKDEDWMNRVIQMDKNKGVVKLELADSADFIQLIFNELKGRRFAFNANSVDNPFSENIPNDMNMTMLGGGGDAGHTYPTLVSGLNSPDFGVYNCDQIYRMKRPVTLEPVYVDSQTGKEINGKHVACVIDLSYNGSFSFHPNSVTCSRQGKNVILLFTKDKRTYVLDQNEFTSAISGATLSPTFEMKDMTTQLKSSKDLKQYLNL